MYHKPKHPIKSITYIAMCVALISLCAWITVPFTISFTLQLFAVFFIAAVSDWKQSFFSVLSYLVLGLAGAPVFAGFQSGLSVLFGITGGYLIGFLVASLLIGIVKCIFPERRPLLLISMILSLLICYGIATLWYISVFSLSHSASSFGQAIAICVLPFLIPDFVKIILAYILANRLAPILRKFEY